MTYFFDNNTAVPITRALRALHVAAVHLSEEFPGDTPDTTWIPLIAERGWVAITADAAIRRKPAERSALERSGLVVLFLPRNFHRRKLWEQAAWYVRFWPRISEQVEDPRRRWRTAQLTDNGKVEAL